MNNISFLLFDCKSRNQHLQVAWAGAQEYIFGRPRPNVSRLRRPGAVRAQPCRRKQKFLSSLSQNSDNEDGASNDEEIVEMDDVLPEPLKIKSYKEALSELNHVTNFFAAQGASQLADELSKVVSKAQSLYLKQRLKNAVQKKITDFFNS